MTDALVHSRPDIRAVLLDYGGVLAEVESPADGFSRMAERVRSVLPTAELSVDDVEVDLRFGWKAYSGWKTAQSRSRDPLEMPQRDFWEMVACDWNDADRAAVFADVVPLTRELELTVIRRPAAASTALTLRALRQRGLKLAIVSNCLSGEAARVQLAEDGLLDLFDVTVFSNEVGCRKPGAAIIRHALEAVNVAPEHACFVGDRLDRDILAAQRAGVQLRVLKTALTGAGAELRGVHPDVTIDDLGELTALVTNTVSV